ncbi:MAG: Acyl dehydratase [Frankiales bacterium]|nr:Acyl dehydratase [Frankiales bacterium]
MTAAPSTVEAGDMFFEDFRVGQVFHSPPHVITEEALLQFAEVSGDKAPLHVDADYAAGTQFGQRLVHGPYGLARFFGALHDLHIVDQTVIGLLDTNWRYLKPAFVGDSLTFDITITRCRRTSAGDQGVVNRHVLLKREDGTVLQEGTTAFLVMARNSAEPGSDPAALDFCGPQWTKDLAARLDGDAEFGAATRSFDGTIGLQAGTVATSLRIYKGKVLEAAAKSLLGPTFTVQASELVWTQLMTGSRNDFIPRTLRGEFSVVGSGYDYLRLTKALMRIWESGREMAGEML